MADFGKIEVVVVVRVCHDESRRIERRGVVRGVLTSLRSHVGVAGMLQHHRNTRGRD